MAQAISTFTRFYAQDSLTYNSGGAVIADGDSLVLILEFWDSATFQGFFFTKTDLSGNEAYRTMLKRNNTTYGAIYGGDAHRTGDGDFIIGTSEYQRNSDYDTGILIKLHNNLDIDYVRSFPDSNFSVLGSAEQLSDGGYLLAGQGGYVDTSGDVIEAFNAWMIKTDTAGNIIWQNEEVHSTYSSFYYTDAINGGFMIRLGVASTYGNGDSLDEVRKYDNQGNLKWTVGFGVPGHDNLSGPMIATHDGGGILVINALDTSAPNLGAITVPGVIYKFDSNGNIQWQKWIPLANGSNNMNLTSLEQTRSWSIILVESLTDLPLGSTNNQHLGGAFLKLDKDGNTIWQNLFFGDSAENNYFYDVTEASDGGIVAIGQATNPATGQLSSWLVKVDSNGCMNGDCPTLYTGITDISAEQGRFMVFPSPAGVQYTVAVTETAYMQQYHDLAFCLYDLTGRMVYQQPLTEQATTIARGDLPTGMYMWHISDSGRNLSNGKIVMK
ncbi:unnamed protein product [Sphagnum jensenii]|uniref:Secretion system C-terminal sorting domain-containing protein n=1 Tax=Sphagnum jensenii TaxID=128206 RepID=A0ABP0VBF5_9BRYO